MRVKPLLLVVLAVSTTACTNIEPGHVGVLIRKCSGGGVEDTPLPIGWHFRNLFCEEIREYPIFQETLILAKSVDEGQAMDESITVNSSEGLPISIDCSLSFTIDPNKVPHIYQKYRNDLFHIEHSYIKQAVREALQETSANYTAEQFYATKRGEARIAVQKFVADRLTPDGFNITQFTINEIRVPQQVVGAINSKVAMVQEAMKAEQEVRKTEAEAKQKVAKAHGDAEARKAMADAEAYYNVKVASSITPALVQMQTVQTQLKAIEKWNGVMPQMTGNGAMPFIQVGNGK